MAIDSDTCKILFIGNSLTGSNDLPGIVQNLSAYAQKAVLVDAYIKYGFSLYDISRLSQTREKINEKKWDYVVIQDGCHNAAYPDSYQILIPYAPYSPLPLTLEIMRDMILDNCESTQVVYFMPWAFKDGMIWVAGQTDTYEDMQVKIYNNTTRFANELNLMLSPVGWAWYRVIHERPRIELFSPDWSHASLEGTYLAACVFYVTFFHEQLTYSTSDTYLPQELATYLQGVASAVVMENQLPLAPSGFKAFSNDLTPTSIHLTWNDPATTISGKILSDYSLHIYRSGSLIVVIDSGVEQYYDSNLIENKRYIYSLMAVKAEYSSGTVMASAYAGGCAIAKSPTQFTAIDSSSGIQLRWKNPSNHVDESALRDLAYIMIYRDNILFDSLEQTLHDTGQIRIYFDSTHGYHEYYLLARDDDTPPNFGAITQSVLGFAGQPLNEYKENFEAGTGLIHTIDKWDTTSSISINGKYSFTDNPAANYAPYSKVSFLLPPVRIDDTLVLSYFDIAIVVPGDSVNIEISRDGRKTFSNILGYDWNVNELWQDGSADSNDWKKEILDLTAYIGDTITIRFRLYTYSGYTSDGWYIDSIRVHPPDLPDPPDSTPVGVISLRSGWNMVSLPLRTEDMDKTTIFSSSSSFAFAYTYGYVICESLQTGAGYWIKYDESADLPIEGEVLLSDTVIIHAGWNMIGALSVPIPLSSIISDPPGIVTSQLYGFDGIYHTEDSLMPAKGYWLRATGSGLLILNATQPIGVTTGNLIKVVPTGEQPPPFPGSEQVIERAIPKEYALEEAYPNPFNPVTTICYRIPAAEYVKLVIFDVAGKEVSTLVDNIESSGIKTIIFSAYDLPSGIYYYRLQAGEFEETKKFILLK